MRWLKRAFATGILLSAFVACSSTRGTDIKSAAAIKREAIDRSACEQSSEKHELDLNRDGATDLWKLINGGEVTCKIVDLNFDGRPDLTKHYTAGQLTLEESDLDFDGKVDMVTVYAAGQAARQELDTNYDGKPDIWKYLAGDEVQRLERDSDGNGVVDYWEEYAAGKLSRRGYDDDKDGQPDRWEDADTIAGAENEGTEEEAADGDDESESTEQPSKPTDIALPDAEQAT
jgi:hypothetical protein